MKSISAIHPAIMENTKSMLVKRAPHGATFVPPFFLQGDDLQ